MAGETLTSFNVDGSAPVKRTAIANAAYTATAADYIVAYTSLSASRVVTIDPVHGGGTAASPKIYIIQDESGSAGTLVTITIAAASGSINGVSVINAAYGRITVYSNGTNLFGA